MRSDVEEGCGFGGEGDAHVAVGARGVVEAEGGGEDVVLGLRSICWLGVSGSWIGG